MTTEKQFGEQSTKETPVRIVKLPMDKKSLLRHTMAALATLCRPPLRRVLVKSNACSGHPCTRVHA